MRYPAHLEPGTQAQNLKDARDRGRMNPGEYQRLKMHCPQNHEYTPENTLTRPNGHRRCRTCSNATEARQRAKREKAA